MIVRVFPDPGPATTRTAPSPSVTARFCSSLRFFRWSISLFLEKADRFPDLSGILRPAFLHLEEGYTGRFRGLLVIHRIPYEYREASAYLRLADYVGYLVRIRLIEGDAIPSANHIEVLVQPEMPEYLLYVPAVVAARDAELDPSFTQLSHQCDHIRVDHVGLLEHRPCLVLPVDFIHFLLETGLGRDEIGYYDEVICRVQFHPFPACECDYLGLDFGPVNIHADQRVI